jgi:hypothetical protein
MPWDDSVTTHTGITEATHMPWQLQRPKEIHRVYVTRTDGGGTQLCWLQVFGNLSGLDADFPGQVGEEHVMAAGVTEHEFPIFGYNYFTIKPLTPIGGDSAIITIELKGDGGQ